MIYFVRDMQSGSIKIGYAKDPKARLFGLRTGHASELKLVGTAPGGRQIEAALHRRYAEYRIRGEWFRPEGELSHLDERLPEIDYGEEEMATAMARPRPRPSYMTGDEVLGLLSATTVVGAERWAQLNGIHPETLAEILDGRRPISEPVLRALGLKERIVYELRRSE